MIVYSGIKSANHGSVITSSTGTPFLPFGSTAKCSRVIVVNDTGTTIEVARVGGTAGSAAIPVFNNSFFSFEALTTLGDLSFRRADVSSTQVTVKFITEVIE